MNYKYYNSKNNGQDDYAWVKYQQKSLVENIKDKIIKAMWLSATWFLNI